MVLLAFFFSEICDDSRYKNNTDAFVCSCFKIYFKLFLWNYSYFQNSFEILLFLTHFIKGNKYDSLLLLWCLWNDEADIYVIHAQTYYHYCYAYFTLCFSFKMLNLFDIVYDLISITFTLWWCFGKSFKGLVSQIS